MHFQLSRKIFPVFCDAVRFMRNGRTSGRCSRSPVKPFDYDVLIQITPETYHDLKDKIGREILSIILNNS